MMSRQEHSLSTAQTTPAWMRPAKASSLDSMSLSLRMLAAEPPALRHDSMAAVRLSIIRPASPVSGTGVLGAAAAGGSGVAEVAPTISAAPTSAIESGRAEGGEDGGFGLRSGDAAWAGGTPQQTLQRSADDLVLNDGRLYWNLAHRRLAPRVAHAQRRVCRCSRGER